PVDFQAEFARVKLRRFQTSLFVTLQPEGKSRWPRLVLPHHNPGVCLEKYRAVAGECGPCRADGHIIGMPAPGAAAKLTSRSRTERSEAQTLPRVLVDVLFQRYQAEQRTPGVAVMDAFSYPS